jgi:hypothetical protein
MLSEAKRRVDRRGDDDVGHRHLVVLQPPALAPEHDAELLAGRDPACHVARRAFRRQHLLDHVARPRRRGIDEVEVGDGPGAVGMDARPLDHPARPGRGAERLVARPAVARVHQPQIVEAEVGHGARRRADVLAQLRVDQDDGRRAGAASGVGAAAFCGLISVMAGG